MKKEEIKFLLDAGFSVEEIQGMSAGQNAVNTAPALSAATPADPVKPAAPAPDPSAAPTPAAHAPAPSPVAGDFTPMLEKLDKILGAIQSANRSAASLPTSTPMTPEEIAGQLIK